EISDEAAPDELLPKAFVEAPRGHCPGCADFFGFPGAHQANTRVAAGCDVVKKSLVVEYAAVDDDRLPVAEGLPGEAVAGLAHARRLIVTDDEARKKRDAHPARSQRRT